MVNYRVVSAIFVALTVIFAASTAYYASSTTTTTRTSVSTTTTTMASVSTLSPSFAVNIAYKSGIGFYLTNATGFTLYFRSTDTPNSGNTTCTTSTCETNWPAFYAATLNLPPGLNASNFATITPYNSTKILTYDGYALFYWAHDAKPGDTTGQGTGGFYVATVPAPAKPASNPTVGTASSATIGNYLVNGTGFTLYYFLGDAPNSGTSTCTGACATSWPVFYTANLVLPSGLSMSSFATITRPDGTKQLTYDGWPLYLYGGDSKSGQTTGQGVSSYGALWYAMPASGPAAIPPPPGMLAR